MQLHQAEANWPRTRHSWPTPSSTWPATPNCTSRASIPSSSATRSSAGRASTRAPSAPTRPQIDNAKLQLVYCRITRPIGGRIGLRLVDPGNIVHATDPNGLLVITQMQPIAVLFTLPEDKLPRSCSTCARGDLQVEAYSRDDRTKIATRQAADHRQPDRSDHRHRG